MLFKKTKNNKKAQLSTVGSSSELPYGGCSYIQIR